MPIVMNDRPPPFFREVHELLDLLEQKVARFCEQFEKANGDRSAVMRDEGLKLQARLAVLKARIDASLGAR